ncbi:MAG TPA: acyltransferase [Noviherbaspirillum sp.]|jgi:peptidoglycan/LPS O-acetylase OafA/YrhL|uniref:acyltransferase family protein n=1 Tax=Noviherbaspirillum sp. TaxID=1926288 RepID=UPI002F92684C
MAAFISPPSLVSLAVDRRLSLIDAIKAIASNLIVLHHLAFYGPMADLARPLLPDLFDWLAADARIAVQAFLVIGGFLAARSLSSRAAILPRAPQLLLKRYLKLALPFIAAMALAAGASALARTWMQHDSISAPASLLQFAAHALLLHDVLGYEALSAGAWYVAIDLQLYALMLALVCAFGSPAAGQRARWLAPLMVSALAALSLWQLNLDPGWDIWAPYFFGSYALGALAWWACADGCSKRGAWTLTGVVVVLAGSALLVAFRSRIALAGTVALLLIAACRLRLSIPGTQSAALGFLGRISYAVFLVHFPVCLVINAAFTRFVPASAPAQFAGVVLAWLASLAAGYAFHRWIEIPLGRQEFFRRPTPLQGSISSTIR